MVAISSTVVIHGRLWLLGVRGRGSTICGSNVLADEAAKKKELRS